MLKYKQDSQDHRNEPWLRGLCDFAPPDAPASIQGVPTPMSVAAPMPGPPQMPCPAAPPQDKMMSLKASLEFPRCCYRTLATASFDLSIQRRRCLLPGLRVSRQDQGTNFVNSRKSGLSGVRLRLRDRPAGGCLLVPHSQGLHRRVQLACCASDFHLLLRLHQEHSGVGTVENAHGQRCGTGFPANLFF